MRAVRPPTLLLNPLQIEDIYAFNNVAVHNVFLRIYGYMVFIFFCYLIII